MGGRHDKKQPLWIEEMCRLLSPVERQTREQLGEEEAAFFRNAANDCLTVSGAVMAAYPGERGYNVVLLTLWGLFKEAYWCHFLFVAGN